MMNRLSALFGAALMLLPLGAGAFEAGDAAFIRLRDSLHLEEVFDLMSAEGQVTGREIGEGLLGGRHPAVWDAVLQRVYDPDRLLEGFSVVLARTLTEANADIGAMADFFESPLGRKVMVLEISARRALLDPSVEEASHERLDELRANDDPRLGLIDEFVASGDLIELNLASAMNATYAFMNGLTLANPAGTPHDDGEILAMVWTQEAELREELETWLYSMLAMAYAPLSDQEILGYTDFSNTKPGQDLNRAMFAGFDAVLTEQSGELGKAAGRLLAGQDL